MKVLKNIGKGLLYVFSPVGLYVLAALIFTLVPANRDFKETVDGVYIYLISNGVHVDIAMPLKADYHDWNEIIDTTEFIPSRQRFKQVAFGWGEREFYLHTPTWADLTFTRACKAILIPTPSAMHVTLREYQPILGDKVKLIRISREQHMKLIEFITDHFKLKENGTAKRINCCNYGNVNDNFYVGRTSYHAFKTCNVWTNGALKYAGIRSAQWAPIESSVLYPHP